MSSTRMRLFTGLVLVLALCIICGCTSTASDMPWNTPQSWEGSPSIPGLSGDRGF